MANAKNNTVDRNELIAKFMGVPKCDRCKGCGYYKFGPGILLTADKMSYHKSWDALLPVYKKLVDMFDVGVIAYDEGADLIENEIQLHILNVDIRNAHIHIAELIDCLNL